MIIYKLPLNITTSKVEIQTDTDFDFALSAEGGDPSSYLWSTTTVLPNWCSLTANGHLVGHSPVSEMTIPIAISVTDGVLTATKNL